MFYSIKGRLRRLELLSTENQPLTHNWYNFEYIFISFFIHMDVI